MDLAMPEVDGVAAILSIRSEFPEARILVLTTYDGDENVYRALENGAKGYLLKDCSTEDLLTAIRKVHSGSTHVSERAAAKLVERTMEDLLAITNFGQKSADEVVQRLDERGLSLRTRD